MPLPYTLGGLFLFMDLNNCNRWGVYRNNFGLIDDLLIFKWFISTQRGLQTVFLQTVLPPLLLPLPGEVNNSHHRIFQLLFTVLLLYFTSKMYNIESSQKKNSFQWQWCSFYNRSVKSDTVKMAIISVLNWLWRKSIYLFHPWKTGFKSEFALKWNQFGGLLTQCLETTGPHHTITLLLLFSLVAFTLETQGIMGEREAKMRLSMSVDLGEIWQPPVRWR